MEAKRPLADDVRALVSLHDVAPAFEDKVRRMWDLCAEAGVRPALCVVPNWHGAWPLERHPRFLEWLRERAAEGAEVILHGERHDEVGCPRDWVDTLRSWHHTARVAEFLALDGPAAFERMARGAAALRRMGFPPVGFIPPAWLCTERCHRSARSAGLAFTEDLRWVYLHATGRRWRVPLIRWSGLGTSRAMVLAALGRVRWTLRHRHSVVRLALHPTDLDLPLSARCVSRALRSWLAAARPVSYAEFAADACEPSRAQGPAFPTRAAHGVARDPAAGVLE